MAGGSGTRFWPMSRVAKPKQFLDIIDSGKTFLRMTYNRFTQTIPQENVLIVASEQYHDLIREQLPQMTKLIIAQRISSVEHCDKILVMDNGVVTGFGTHDELLATNALYKEIYDIQMADKGDFDKKGGEA